MPKIPALPSFSVERGRRFAAASLSGRESISTPSTRSWKSMIDRCHASKLHLTQQKEQAKLDFAILLTVQTMNYLHSGRHKVAL
jgi:hypothetical protein